MPQKICNLCSDKISDFYEFREMCTATNVQTRDLLGLPREETKLLKAQLPVRNLTTYIEVSFVIDFFFVGT